MVNPFQQGWNTGYKLRNSKPPQSRGLAGFGMRFHGTLLLPFWISFRNSRFPFPPSSGRRNIVIFVMPKHNNKMPKEHARQCKECARNFLDETSLMRVENPHRAWWRLIQETIPISTGQENPFYNCVLLNARMALYDPNA